MTTASWSVDFCSSAASSAFDVGVVVGAQQTGLVGDAAGRDSGSCGPPRRCHGKRDRAASATNKRGAQRRGAQLVTPKHHAAIERQPSDKFLLKRRRWRYLLRAEVDLGRLQLFRRDVEGRHFLRLKDT